MLLPGKGLKQGPYVSEEELLALTDAAADDDVIEQEERQLIRSVFEFGDTVAREVMVPRPDIVAVEGGQQVSDVIDVAMKAGFSRIPVYDETIDNIVGVVFTKDLLRAEREGKADVEVRNLAREGMFVPESKPVAELMREMQRKKLHLAFVLDEFGDTAGLVTLEDLIEELVGEINDEYDVEEAPIERLPNGDVAGQRQDADRRSQRTAQHRPARGRRLGHRRRPGVQPARARARRRRDRAWSTVTRSPPSGCRVAASVGCGSASVEIPSRHDDYDDD